MKVLKIAGVSAVALIAAGAAAPVFAGGYEEPTPAPAPVIVAQPVAPSNWAGPYVGAYLGYGEDDTDSNLDTPDLSGAVGGLVAGYNWQAGRWVYGVEGQLGTADFDETYEKAGGNTKAKVSTTGAIRGRLGYDMGNWMPYAVVGASFAKADYDQYNAAGDNIGSDSETMSGYTVGVGAEYRLQQNWSLTGEYTFTSYDGKFNDGAVDSDVDHDVNELRVGVNYHF